MMSNQKIVWPIKSINVMYFAYLYATASISELCWPYIWFKYSDTVGSFIQEPYIGKFFLFLWAMKIVFILLMAITSLRIFLFSSLRKVFFYLEHSQMENMYLTKITLIFIVLINVFCFSVFNIVDSRSEKEFVVYVSSMLSALLCLINILPINFHRELYLITKN